MEKTADIWKSKQHAIDIKKQNSKEKASKKTTAAD